MTEVTPEDIQTWRATFPELATWKDENIAKYASLFKKPFIQKPYALPTEKPAEEEHERD